MLERQLAIASLALAVGACGGSTPSVAEAPPTVGPPPRLVLPRRPHQVEDVPVDYASLPRMTPLALAPDAKGPSFKRRTDGLYELHMPDDLYAEIQVGSMIFFSIPNQSQTSIVGAPNQPQNNRQGGEVTTPSAAGTALCGKSAQSLHAVWIGFSPRTKTPGSMEFVRYEGDFDPATCSTRPTAAWHVQAPAILEGSLYAFRGGSLEADPSASTPEKPPASVPPAIAKSVAAKKREPAPPALLARPPGNLPGVEKLEIIGPKSIWVGSTAPTPEQRQPLAQPFARLVVPISRGSTATAVLDVAGDDLKAFRGIDTSDLADAKVVSFSFDVVWGSSEKWPTAIATMSALPGLPEQLVPPQSSPASYDFEVNLEE